MTIAISREVSEFTSDTIQTTSENTALPTKDRHFLNSFCNSSKRSSVLSAPPLTLAMLESGSRRITQKEIMYSSCIWHSSKGSFHNGKKKEKSARAGSTPGRTCISLSSNEVKRDHMVLPPANHLDNHICVCDSLSFSHLPHPWPPCQPPLPTTAPQLRCDRFPRPKGVQCSQT